jgi:hypothetical protein
MAAGLQCGSAANRHERRRFHIGEAMTRATPTDGRRNQVLIVLAAAWIAVSMAIGSGAAEVSGAARVPQPSAASDQADRP